VGDDDQSIYAWRGADSRWILAFERDYPDARVVKLEQNYRSPRTILDAAYGVICQNRARKDKRLWTERDGGELIKCYQAHDEHDEGHFVARTIRELVDARKQRYSDFAVLYRMNALSRVLEQMMLSQGIPYRVVGGQKFFARKEIKDVVAYLRVLHNPADAVSLKRIINTPVRGIGDKTIATIEDVAAMRGVSLYEAMLAVEHLDLAPRAIAAVRAFAVMLQRLAVKATSASISDLIRDVLDESGYEKALEADKSVQARTRLENVREMISAALQFEREAGDEDSIGLRAFLEQVALVTDMETQEQGDDVVTLMTLHAAKGLEFPHVFLVGLEEGIFPLGRAATSGKRDDLEEERRLCYVGITRAMEQLYCTVATSRMIFGRTEYTSPSRFLGDIPEELMEGVPGHWSAPTRTSAAYTPPTILAPVAPPVRPMPTATPPIPKPAPPAPRPTETWAEADSAHIPAAQAILAANRPHDGAFRAGERVRHKMFGDGLVLAIQGTGDDTNIMVNFNKVGMKKLKLAYAGLERV
jgi:DNA helicase-2/ATP-dependent DNA helicase PcrA